MADSDRYALLSKIVRIASTGNRSHPARLKETTKFLTDALGLQCTTIYLLDDGHHRISRYITANGRGEFNHCHIMLGEGVAGQCAALRKAFTSSQEHLHTDEVRTGKETAILALPLGDMGVISFGYARGSRLEHTDHSFLLDLITPIVGLLERSRLIESSDRKVANLIRLSTMGQLLNRPIPLREMLAFSLDACLDHSDSSCVVLRLLEEKGVPSGLFRRCPRKLLPRLPELLAIEEISSKRVLANGDSLLICDLIAEGPFPPSYISVPLTFKTKALGVLTFFGKRNGKGRYCNFTEEDRDLFEGMAMLIANALAEAANYEQLLKLSRENDKKVKELSFLFRFSNIMLSTVRLNRLVQLTLTTLVCGSESLFERAMLFLINERSGVIQGMLGVTRESAEALLKNRTGRSDPLADLLNISDEEMDLQQVSDFSREVRGSRLDLNRSLNVCSRAIAEKRVILVSDPQKEKRVDQEFLRRFNISSFAVAPLVAKDRVIGVVIVDNPSRKKPISRDDLRFLQLFANQAGMAIENSLLYSRLTDANRSLHETRERLMHSARLATIGTMAASIAHELKGPLVSIGGFARRLRKSLSRDASASASADTIIHEVLRLEQMLTDILSYARKTTICYSRCNISDIIDDSLSIVGPAMEEKAITILKNLPRKPISFQGDSKQLKQVFINLFLNSLEAMASGGALQIQASQGKLNGATAVSVRIADSGGGIPQDVINQIFNPFYTTKESGTGLGLAIANRIVTNHGGKIQVHNREQGAEFTVLLPLSG